MLGEARSQLEPILPGYLRGRRWFGGKAHRILSARVMDAIAVPYRGGRGYLAMVRVDYAEADAQFYLLPLICTSPDRARGYRASALCQDQISAPM